MAKIHTENKEAKLDKILAIRQKRLLHRLATETDEAIRQKLHAALIATELRRCSLQSSQQTQ